MTAAELTAELSGLYKSRDAIEILADKHGCNPAEVRKLICCTREFDIFDAVHSRHMEASQIIAKKTKIEWDKENETAITELYLSGYSANAISKMYETTESTINRHLKKLGVPIRKRPVLSSYMYDDIVAERNRGTSFDKLAQQYHVKSSTLQNFLSRCRHES